MRDYILKYGIPSILLLVFISIAMAQFDNQPNPPTIQPVTAEYSDEEVSCLAHNIYFESRNESTAGQLAVADVTLNRLFSEKYPNTICDVIMDGPHYTNWRGIEIPVRDRCQFSWYCDGKNDTVTDTEKYVEIYLLASDYLNGNYNRVDLTDGAMYYHANYVNPSWAKTMTVTATIDNHIFYRLK